MLISSIATNIATHDGLSRDNRNPKRRLRPSRSRTNPIIAMHLRLHYLEPSERVEFRYDLMKLRHDSWRLTLTRVALKAAAENVITSHANATSLPSGDTAGSNSRPVNVVKRLAFGEDGVDAVSDDPERSLIPAPMNTTPNSRAPAQANVTAGTRRCLAVRLEIGRTAAAEESSFRSSRTIRTLAMCGN